MDDVIQNLGLIRRSVSTVELDGKTARRTVSSRAYPTDADDLWDALTNPERIPRWFLPITGDLKVGGHYQLEGNAGGTVEQCEPPRQFRVTWEMNDAPTWVTVTLTPEAGETRLDLDHVGHVPEEFWTQFGPGATGVGWDLALNGLGLHIASGGAAVDPAEFQAWSMSPAGTEFIRQANDGWKDASIASGTPAEDATASAGRTFAFYTGQ